MRLCDHNFHAICQKEKPLYHVIVGCAYCGEVRYIYADGSVVIHRPIDGSVKNYAKDNDTNKTTE